MKKWLLPIALSLSIGSAWADPFCYPVTTNLTVFGTAVRQDVELSDGSTKAVWMLAMDPPLCVIDRRFSRDAQGRIAVSRIQLIGPPPPPNVPLAVTGVLSTKNAPEYFIMPTAMWVTPPRKKNAP